MNTTDKKNLPFLFSFNLGKIPVDTALLNFMFLVFVIYFYMFNLFMARKMRKERGKRQKKQNKTKKTVIQQNKNKQTDLNTNI